MTRRLVRRGFRSVPGRRRHPEYDDRQPSGGQHNQPGDDDDQESHAGCNEAPQRSDSASPQRQGEQDQSDGQGRWSASLAALQRQVRDDHSVDLDDATRLAFLYMRLHELDDWQFRLDRATSRFGSCNHRCKTITMSRLLVTLNDKREVRDTILHEIAHALAGPKAVSYTHLTLPTTPYV